MFLTNAVCVFDPSSQERCATHKRAGEPSALSLAEEQGSSQDHGWRSVATTGPDAARHTKHSTDV